MDLYRKIGIDPPRGVLLYGPPGVSAVLVSRGISCADLICPLGTGKTMIVKAVANATSASFIRVVGSEFVQKYLGEVSAICSDLMWALVVLTSAGPAHGPRRLPTRTRELAVYHLH